MAEVSDSVGSNPSAAGANPNNPSDIDEGLQRTGRFAGGLIDDLKRRMPWYADDFRQGFHTKVLGSTLFLYFACLPTPSPSAPSLAS